MKNIDINEDTRRHKNFPGVLPRKYHRWEFLAFDLKKLSLLMIIYDYFMIIDNVIIKMIIYDYLWLQIIICDYEMIIYDYLWLFVVTCDYL